MKITEETKIKDLIPEGYEYSDMITINHETQGQIVISYAKKQPKTIEDYERELAEMYSNHSFPIQAISQYGDGGTLNSEMSFTQVLRAVRPKQYYSIILEMIRDDICTESIARQWFIDANGINQLLNFGAQPTGVVLFDTKKHTEQGRKIMGDKLKFLI